MTRKQQTPPGGDLAAAAAQAATVGGAAQAGTAEGSVEGGPLPLQPGVEYVAKTDWEAIAAERDDLKAQLQRVAADFDNFRKRSAREREMAAKAADAKLLGELLAVIDDMERAVGHVEPAEADHPSLAQGIRMVHSRLDGVLRSHGLEPIETTGTFDPALHEAMMLQPSDEPDGTILQVLEGGWTLDGRVLRHARVIVAGEH